MAKNSLVASLGSHRGAGLTRDEEKVLATKLRSRNAAVRQQARNELVEANVRFVAHLAYGYARTSDVHVDEFISAGLEAMIANADKFDADRSSFCTFIKPWIRKAFQEMHHERTLVNVPRYKRISVEKVKNATARLVAEHGPFAEITDDMIAEAAGMTVEQVRECQSINDEFLGHAASLDAPVGDDEDGATLMDIVAETSAATTHDEHLSSEMEDALALLTPEEAQVLMMTAGLDGDEPQPPNVISKSLGISTVRVKQLLSSAQSKMAGALGDK